MRVQDIFNILTKIHFNYSFKVANFQMNKLHIRHVIYFFRCEYIQIVFLEIDSNDIIQMMVTWIFEIVVQEVFNEFVIEGVMKSINIFQIHIADTLRNKVFDILQANHFVLASHVLETLVLAFIFTFL